MPRKIVLLSFRYPPYNQVGAYRWAKLSRKLAELGHAVHVCTVRWPDMGQTAWLADVVHPNIHVHASHSGYVQRLKYRHLPWAGARWLRKQALRLEKRFGPDDEARFWGPFLRRSVRRLMRVEAPEVLIATGPPFSVNRAAARLKEELPRLKLIQDFRDPWSRATSEGARELTHALGAADLVVAVTAEMAESLERSGARRTAWISNGFEPELLAKLAPSTEKSFDFVHIGALFNDRAAPLARFLDWVRVRQRSGKPVSVALIGRYQRTLARDYEDLVAAGQLVLLEQVSQERALQFVARSRFALQLNAPEASTQVSTKIFEYGALRVPTVSINYGGAIDTLVKRHGLGVSIDARDDEFDERLDRWMQSNAADLRYDVEPFRFERLAQHYSELIEGL